MGLQAFHHHHFVPEDEDLNVLTWMVHNHVLDLHDHDGRHYYEDGTTANHYKHFGPAHNADHSLLHDEDLSEPKHESRPRNSTRLVGQV